MPHLGDSRGRGPANRDPAAGRPRLQVDPGCLHLCWLWLYLSWWLLLWFLLLPLLLPLLLLSFIVVLLLLFLLRLSSTAVVVEIQQGHPCGCAIGTQLWWCCWLPRLAHGAIERWLLCYDEFADFKHINLSRSNMKGCVGSQLSMGNDGGFVILGAYQNLLLSLQIQQSWSTFLVAHWGDWLLLIMMVSKI